MKLIDTTPKLFTPEQAEAVADTLNEGDEDGWEYVVVNDQKGNGFSLIEVYDENARFVTYFT